jgi:hypothetical protein
MTIEQYVPRAEISLASVQDAAVHRLGEWAQSADAAYQVAERLSQSSFVPAQYRGKPVELTAAILAGIEVGLSPMAAMRSFDMIQGVSAPRAITLRAVVQAHGHELVLIESTNTRCRMKGKRRGSDEWQAVTWTIERAQGLGLTGKDNWKKQPGAMLVARATSELARLVASDAILGIGYSSEEIADGGSYEQQVDGDTTGPQQASGTRRMSRPKTSDPAADTSAPVSDRTADEVMSADANRGPGGEPSSSAGSESPLLNTSSRLAKRMFALFGDIGLTERDDRLAYVASVIGHEVESSAAMTDADAVAVIGQLESDLAQPFDTDAS